VDTTFCCNAQGQHTHARTKTDPWTHYIEGIFFYFRKQLLTERIFHTNEILNSLHLKHEVKVETERVRICLMAEMLAHLKIIPKLGLRGGSPEPGEGELELTTNSESDLSLDFDSDGREMIGQIIENSLKFDSEAENYLIEENSKCGNLSDLGTASEDLIDEENENQESGFVKYVLKSKSFCSISCHQNCETIVSENWSVNEIKEMKELFSDMQKIDVKNFLLDHLKKQEVMGFTPTGFLYKGQLFCFRSFQYLTGVSKYLIEVVVNAASEGLVKFEHGSQGQVLRFSAAKIGFIVWMKSFALHYGQYSPDELCQVLPGHLRLVDLLRYYEDESPKPRVQPSTFYRLFNETFSHRRADKSLPWIRISKYSTHSRCDSCLILDQKRRIAKSAEEIDFIKSLSYKHLESHHRSRIHVQTLRHQCLSFPAEYLMFQLDDMDNAKSYLPRCVEPGKKLGKLARVPSKITGCITSSGHYQDGRKIQFLINHNQFEQSGSKTVTIIYKLIKDYISDHKVLPKNLIVNCDNCWRENKVSIILSV
jgi:hypothetical protein